MKTLGPAYYYDQAETAAPIDYSLAHHEAVQSHAVPGVGVISVAIGRLANRIHSLRTVTESTGSEGLVSYMIVDRLSLRDATAGIQHRSSSKHFVVADVTPAAVDEVRAFLRALPERPDDDATLISRNRPQF
jgi:hypothetical protein